MAMNNLHLNPLKLTKLLAVSIAIFISSMQVAHAYDTAKLQIEISGAQKDKYLLCVSDVGCVRLDSNKQIDSNKQSIPINTMNVRYIFVASTATYQMYPQTLPSSCHVAVNGNQKLVVKGSVSKAGNDKVYIANLHCAVS
jgi:hypothetical protein